MTWETVHGQRVAFGHTMLLASASFHPWNERIDLPEHAEWVILQEVWLGSHLLPISERPLLSDAPPTWLTKPWNLDTTESTRW